MVAAVVRPRRARANVLGVTEGNDLAQVLLQEGADAACRLVLVDMAKLVPQQAQGCEIKGPGARLRRPNPSAPAAI
jgi:hypothetical protein